MIGDVIGIYRARRDPKLAARLAARFAQGQLLDRISAPLLVPLVLLWSVVILCALLVALSVWGFMSLHGAVAWLGLLPAGIGYLAFRVQAGLRAGLRIVQDLAESYTERGMDRVLAVGAADPQD